MLVLSRKRGETVCIGDDIKIRVIGVYGKRVKIGIEAPTGYRILRAELTGWTEEEVGEPPAPKPDYVPV